MLRTEVGSDGVVPAVEKTANHSSLVNEFTESLSDPKTWLVGGAAVVTAAVAVKFGRLLIEGGRTAINDGALAAAIKKGNPETAIEVRFLPSPGWVIENGGRRAVWRNPDAASAFDYAGYAQIPKPGNGNSIMQFDRPGYSGLAKPGETGILGMFRDGRFVSPNEVVKVQK